MLIGQRLRDIREMKNLKYIDTQQKVQVMTFLNPNAKAAAHQSAGNKYDSLMNKVRMFWCIDCWRAESEEVLTERLKYFSEQKDNLNLSCPQTPRIAYWLAKRGIAAGEGKYKVGETTS